MSAKKKVFSGNRVPPFSERHCFVSNSPLCYVVAWLSFFLWAERLPTIMLIYCWEYKPIMTLTLFCFFCRCRRWLQVVGDIELVFLSAQFLCHSRFVCSDHFVADNYHKNSRRLKVGCVPSVFPADIQPLSDLDVQLFPVSPVSESIIQKNAGVHETCKYFWSHWNLQGDAKYTLSADADYFLRCALPWIFSSDIRCRVGSQCTNTVCFMCTSICLVATLIGCYKEFLTIR